MYAMADDRVSHLSLSGCTRSLPRVYGALASDVEYTQEESPDDLFSRGESSDDAEKPIRIPVATCPVFSEVENF